MLDRVARQDQQRALGAESVLEERLGDRVGPPPRLAPAERLASRRRRAAAAPRARGPDAPPRRPGTGAPCSARARPADRSSGRGSRRPPRARRRSAAARTHPPRRSPQRSSRGSAGTGSSKSSRTASKYELHALAAPLGGDDLPAPLRRRARRRRRRRTGRSRVTAPPPALGVPAATSRVGSVERDRRRPRRRAGRRATRAPARAGAAGPRLIIARLERGGDAGVVVGARSSARRAPRSPAAGRRARRAARRRRGRAASPTPRACTRCEPSSWRIFFARCAIGSTRRVDARGDERRQHAVDEQVGGDERVPVGQLVVEQREAACRGRRALVAGVGAERLEHRVGGARVAELVLRHRGGGDGGLERRRADTAHSA